MSFAHFVPAQRASTQELLLFDSINRERAALQLAPVKWDDALADAARQHAQRMAAQHQFAHQLPGEPNLSQRAGLAGAHFARIAENIATGADAAEIHEGWMLSPGHRANILNAQFNAAGVGVVEQNRRLYAVEDFAVAVESLGFKAQEDQVLALLRAKGVQATATDIARQACAGGLSRTGTGSMYLLWYETSELREVPDRLVKALRQGGYRKASVGACAPRGASEGFARFRIAVVLF